MSPAAPQPLRHVRPDDFLPGVKPWVHAAALVLMGSAVAGVYLLAVWPYRVVVRGGGVVRPSGETSVLHAPFAGRVQQVRMQLNQRVKAGQVLALLDPTDLDARRRQLGESQQAIGLQAKALQQQGQAAVQASQLEVQKSAAALRFAEAEYARFRQLAGTGAITATQLQEKQENFNVARANLAKAREAVVEQRSRNTSEQLALAKELAASRAAQGQMGRDLRSTQLKAPVSGVIRSLNLRNPQQVVAAGQELATIAPQAVALLVKVQVRSQEIDRVEVGQSADLRIQGCPYPDFGTLKAEVASIAPDVLPASAGGGYEVTLRPLGRELVASGRRCELRIGMDLSADIVTRSEPLLRFLLRKARLSIGA